MDKIILFLGLLVFLLGFLHVEATSERSLVTHLPGFKALSHQNITQGKYVRLGTKNLYYYFASSERNPSNDPLVLWLNGGPGCSSFDGFVYEHGPFNFKEGKHKEKMPTLHLNRYSWSKVSNIIYLDSPTGVGYSFSKNISDYENASDDQTAIDTHNFLLEWLKLFPEFISNPFYLSGESYAGVYVPLLASKIVEGIKAQSKPRINLKGYMIGNGVTHSKFDDEALVPFAHGMGLISEELYEEVHAACNGSYDYPSTPCNNGLDKVDDEISGLNIYNVLAPCYHYPDEKLENVTSLPASYQQLGKTERPLPVRKRIFGRAWPLRLGYKSRQSLLWPELARIQHVPCVNDVVATLWLNNKDVRKALHAETEKIAGPWELCTDRISYYSDLVSMIPYHVNLTKAGYRALIFSGDHDMCVPFTGTQAWTRSLGYETIDAWRPWKTNRQVAGYLQAFEHDLTFITIKGSGHTVPEYKPRESLYFYSHWLDGKPL